MPPILPPGPSVCTSAATAPDWSCKPSSGLTKVTYLLYKSNMMNASPGWLIFDTRYFFLTTRVVGGLSFCKTIDRSSTRLSSSSAAAPSTIS